MFKPVAEASIVRMQNIIEGLCHAVKKQERKRDEAGGKFISDMIWACEERWHCLS